MRRLGSVAAALALAAGAASCASPPPASPPPLPVPRVTASVRHFHGTPLSGPVAAAADAGAPEQALQAVVAFLVLERVPQDLLEPLGAQSRLVVSNRWTTPIRACSEVLAGARAGAVPDGGALLEALEAGRHGRAAPIALLRGVLPPGVTASFELGRRRQPAGGAAPVREGLEVMLRRVRRPAAAGGEALELAIAIEDAGAAGPEPPAPRREMALLDLRPLEGVNDIALAIPSPFAGEEALALVALATVTAPPPPEGVSAEAHRAAFGACLADLAREAALAGTPALPRPGPPALTPPPDLHLARRALADPKRRRAALAALAQSAGARVSEEVALSGDEPILATVTAAIAADLASIYVPSVGPALGWVVERSALRALSNLRRRAEAVGQPDLYLIRRAGAAGRIDEILLEALGGARDLEDFDRRLVEANRGLLMDGDPAVRARACDWLAARGLAPPDYDPLGSLEARRSALDRAAAPAGAEGGGR